MKMISILPSVLLAAIAAQAQVVSDGATRTLANTNGRFSFTNAIDAGIPQRFFLLRTP